MYNYKIMIYMHRGTIGQQCCYNSNGDYTKDGKSAGSSDYSYPMEHYLKHQISDYFPYRACCIESKDSKICNDYYELRPQESNVAKQCDSNSSEKGIVCVKIYIYICVCICITCTYVLI